MASKQWPHSRHSQPPNCPQSNVRPLVPMRFRPSMAGLRETVTVGGGRRPCWRCPRGAPFRPGPGPAHAFPSLASISGTDTDCNEGFPYVRRAGVHVVYVEQHSSWALRRRRVPMHSLYTVNRCRGCYK